MLNRLLFPLLCLLALIVVTNVEARQEGLRLFEYRPVGHGIKQRVEVKEEDELLAKLDKMLREKEAQNDKSEQEEDEEEKEEKVGDLSYEHHHRQTTRAYHRPTTPYHHRPTTPRHHRPTRRHHRTTRRHHTPTRRHHTPTHRHHSTRPVRTTQPPRPTTTAPVDVSTDFF